MERLFPEVSSLEKMDETRIGRYVIQKEIGRGGQSRAYLAHDPAIERTVAIKQIRAATELQEDSRDEFVARFLQEARVAGTLSHPNIVSIHDLGEDKNGPYIVMEFVDGQTLNELIEGSDGLDQETVTRIFLQICAGLSFAHEHGVVHRDVKPANIMLTKDGQVKLLDFGIARVATAHLTQTGTLLGTPSYMSPEQIQGQKVDLRSDIFSLGIVLFEVLTARLPFGGQNPTTMIFRIVSDPHSPLAEIDASLAGVFGAIIDRCLEKSPVDRYQGCRELAADLCVLLPDESRPDHPFDTTMGTAAAISRSLEADAGDNATLVAGSGGGMVPETQLAVEAPGSSFPLSPRSLAMVGGAVAVVLLLAVFLVVSRLGPDETDVSPATAADLEALEISPATQLLREARAALEDGKLVGEDRDDALFLAGDALELGEPAAREVVDQVRERLREQTLREARNARPETAVASYDRFLTYFPGDEQMQTLREQMSGQIVQADRLREVEDLAAQGQAALADGDLDTAAENFQRILRAAPNDSYAAHMLGRTQAARGELESARRYLERAVSLSPLDPTMQMDLADVLERLHQYDAAAAAVHRAIGLGAGKASGAEVLKARLRKLEVKKELADLLPIRAEGKHTHFLRRSCKGQLTVTSDSIEFQPEENSEHAFQFDLKKLQSFRTEKQSLAISSPEGKKYNFDDLPEDAVAALAKLQQVLDKG